MNKTANKNNTNYHVHDFMLELGLSPNELAVYALIYSFTKGAIGVFYGSQEYLAKLIGISRRTVIRVYRKLYDMHLIEKCNSSEEKKKGIRALVRKPEETEESDGCILPEIKKTPKTAAEIEDSLPYLEEKFFPIEIPGCDTLAISAEQYKKLRELVPPDVLYGYARRFDRYMYKRLEGMLPTPRSHYKVIKKWIEEDFSG